VASRRSSGSRSKVISSLIVSTHCFISSICCWVTGTPSQHLDSANPTEMGYQVLILRSLDHMSSISLFASPELRRIGRLLVIDARHMAVWLSNRKVLWDGIAVDSSKELSERDR
jgi:hypothetical protein